jgi:hypothetical protein
VARRGPNAKFSIVVEGLDRLHGLDNTVHTRQRQFLDATAKRVAANIALKAPGGPGGSVGASFHATLLTDTVASVASHHPGAKALDRGAYIAPKHGQKVVRWFSGGEPQFARFVRLPARRYVRAGLRNRNQLAAQEFDQIMRGL